MSWVDTVRSLYGERAAQLVADGWTADAAIDHVQGTCDRALCGGVHDVLQLDAQQLLRDAASYTAAATEALADEHEGRFTASVRALAHTAQQLHSLTEEW